MVHGKERGARGELSGEGRCFRFTLVRVFESILLFQVVRDEAKDAERKSKRRAEAERRRDESAKSLFDFINVKLRSGTGINIDPNHGKRKSKNGFSNNKRTESVPLKEETSKNLKIMHENILSTKIINKWGSSTKY